MKPLFFDAQRSTAERTVACKMADAESRRPTGLAETDGLTLGEWCRHVLLARADGERLRTIEETVLAEGFAPRTIPQKSHRAARIPVIQ